ncbi:hypothetical protein CCR85_01015 [Rhodothalassium salexigens]|uniref:acyl-CoA thioesterase n=1 Tax=Rhodothalassium salexigens TaxID=1086 RepID=UPI001913290A|nr:thioesterase family protein [Rhodothalassium salexigens]MBK5910074.1 hypothetical protein [Rhodothalassium salexigens]MBK5921759.1 hypothetical protein [Rhodothalassium salexigens]
MTDRATGPDGPTRLAPAERRAFRFFHRLRVRWAEVDAQGIVFNAQYYFLFDVAMTEFFRHLGLPPDMSGQGGRGEMFTAASTASFHAPARFDDPLDIGVGAERLGRSSVTMGLGIWRGDELLTTGQMVYVYADPHARTGVALPADFRALLEDWLLAKPAAAEA